LKEIALFLKNPKNTAISKECASKYAENPVLRDAQSENFLGEDPQTPLLILRVNLGKLFVSPL
jgi:hypothetical protein